jgi:hypothetical protein
MTTTNELTPLHAPAYLSVGPLTILVKVINSRTVFGRVDCLVSPIHGKGQQWVSEERLQRAPVP